MRIAKIAPLSLMLAGLATPALAMEQGDTYLGGGFGMFSYDENGLEEAEPTALIGRLGYFVTDNFVIESRLGFGLTDDDVSVSGVSVDVEIDQVAGVYGIGHLPLTKAFSLYGLAGFTYGELSASVGNLSVDDNDTDFSYGVGGQYDIAEDVAAFVEWAQYFDESNYEVTGVTVGANINF